MKGDVALFGHDTKTASLSTLGRLACIVFPSAVQGLVGLTVADELAFSLRTSPLAAAAGEPTRCFNHLMASFNRCVGRQLWHAAVAIKVAVHLLGKSQGCSRSYNHIEDYGSPSPLRRFCM